MTADDLRAVPTFVNNAMGHTVVPLLVTEAERDALADLIDAAREVVTHVGSVEVEGSEALDALGDALAALDQETPTPPPDPAAVVAEAWVEAVGWTWDPSWPSCKRVLAAVRDLFPTSALAQAAAKVQEADRDG